MGYYWMANLYGRPRASVDVLMHIASFLSGGVLAGHTAIIPSMILPNTVTSNVDRDYKQRHKYG